MAPMSDKIATTLQCISIKSASRVDAGRTSECGVMWPVRVQTQANDIHDAGNSAKPVLHCSANDVA